MYIEFSGLLTGESEKYFHNKAVKFGLGIILTALGLFLPGVIALGVFGGIEEILYGYLAISVFLIAFCILPKGKKNRIAITPKKIHTDGESITVISDKYAETKFIDDIKIVYDRGDFYEIMFRIGNYSEKFICQKNLLTKGSLEEFEELFGDKLVKTNN